VLILLPLLGLSLKGTSSVLYGPVPELAPPKRRTRAFGLFYTGGSLAGVVLITLPLAKLLQPAIERRTA
jgi:predicted MFS family arabinose efflux permease